MKIKIELFLKSLSKEMTDVAPPLPPESADGWVQCDMCDRWRRLPLELVDALGDGRW